MFESLLSIRNLCWSDDAYQEAIGPDAIRASGEAPLHGRFACASAGADGSVTLARDRIGLNKLFVAVHESGNVVAGNYLVDLFRLESIGIVGVPVRCRLGLGRQFVE